MQKLYWNADGTPNFGIPVADGVTPGPAAVLQLPRPLHPALGVPGAARGERHHPGRLAVPHRDRPGRRRHRVAGVDQLPRLRCPNNASIRPTAHARSRAGSVPRMRFGLFIPQGWRQDLTGIEPRGPLADHERPGHARRRGRRLRARSGSTTTSTPCPSPTARRRTRPGASSTRSPRAPAGSASARCAPAWRTGTRPTWRRSPRRRTSSRAAASRWASAPAGTSTSGSRTATASRRPGSGSRCSTRACRSSSRCGPTAPRPWTGSTTRSTARSCRRSRCRSDGPPLWIAGGGEKKTLRIAAEHAAYTNFAGAPEAFAHKSEILRGHCEAIGRPFEEITRSANYNVVIGATQAEVDDRIAWVEEHLRSTVPPRPRRWRRTSATAPLVGTPSRSSSGCRSSRSSA